MIATCCVPRLYDIEGKSYRLAPVSLRQAVEFFAATTDATDTDDRQLAIELVMDWPWMGPGFLLASHLQLAAKNNYHALVKSLTQLITQGLDHKKILQGEKQPAGGKETAEPQREKWDESLSFYCGVYGADPWQVWNHTPFVFFLAMIDQARRQQALNNLTGAAVVNAGFSGGKKQTAKWEKQARDGRPEKTKYQLMTETMSAEELEAERDRLRENARKHTSS